YRLGVVRRRHHGERTFKPDANRCSGRNRQETVGSHDSRRFARIEDGNQIYRGSLSGGGPSEGSSGSCASGPAWGVRILNGAFRCIGEGVARLPKAATIASTSTPAAMK